MQAIASQLLVHTFQQVIEPRAKQEVMSALCSGLVVDLTFELSENVAILNMVSLISYSWPAVRGVVFICACALYELALDCTIACF